MYHHVTVCVCMCVLCVYTESQQYVIFLLRRCSSVSQNDSLTLTPTVLHVMSKLCTMCDVYVHMQGRDKQ